MVLTSSIVAYNATWPEQFETERARLAGVFGAHAQAIHHVGSTAVAGLSAKPEIDILVVIDDIGTIARHHAGLESLGYRVRPDRVAPSVKAPESCHSRITTVRHRGARWPRLRGGAR